MTNNILIDPLAMLTNSHTLAQVQNNNIKTFKIILFL